MSNGRPVNRENPSARRKADLELDRYPFSDGRQAVARQLVAHIKDDDCVVWPSALKLAFRAGVSEDTVQRALADFDRTGLTVRVPGFVFPIDPDDEGKPKRRIARRVEMHRIHELYPANIGWTEFQTRNRAKQQKCDRKRLITASRGNPDDASVTALRGNPERFDDVRVTANDVSGYRMNGAGLPQTTPRFAAPCSTSVFSVSMSDIGAALAAQAAPPSASAAAALHPAKDDVMQRSKKSAASPEGDVLTPAEVTERFTRMQTLCRSHLLIKGNAEPPWLRQLANDPRVSLAVFDEAMRRYYTDGDRHYRARSFVKIIESVLNEGSRHNRRRR